MKVNFKRLYYKYAVTKLKLVTNFKTALRQFISASFSCLTLLPGGITVQRLCTRQGKQLFDQFFNRCRCLNSFLPELSEFPFSRQWDVLMLRLLPLQKNLLFFCNGTYANANKTSSHV